MEARELNVGNITHNGRIVKEIYEDSVKLDNGVIVNLIALEPEKLTEEWLKTFNFEKINHIHGYSFYSLIRKRGSGMPAISIYQSRTEVNGTIVTHVKYVHQLQNLYFAITGQELTLT